MTERALPRPLVEDGVVTIDQRTRTLIVKPARSASGWAKAVWRDGVRAQRDAARFPAQPGFPARAATVWAAGAGESRIAYGLPTDADDRALAFRFAVGDPVYRRLVSTVGLRARIAVDTAATTGREIIGVAFGGRA